DWDQWLGRVAQTMSDVDGPIGTTQGPDRLAIQFPVRAMEAVERPYFLGGDATGLGKFAAAPGSPQVTHSAKFIDGEWQVQFTRAFTPTDTTKAPGFM